MGGGRSASPPDASLTTMMVVFVSNLLLFPPLGVFRSRLLQMKYYYYCFRCWKGGVLVAVVDAPVEGRLKSSSCCSLLLWILSMAAGGVGAVRSGNIQNR